jgi:acetyl-CoA carboxylase biotin carboxyl carrier protein
MNLKEIKELIEIIRGTDVSEIELEREGSRIRIRLGDPPGARKAGILPVREIQVEQVSTKTAKVSHELAAEAAHPEAEAGQIVVSSPMVGTFYRSPTAGDPSFVEIGDAVEIGQPLCIIEAMKLMNEIEAEYAGRLVRILKEDKEPVEYGEPLFVLETIA